MITKPKNAKKTYSSEIPLRGASLYSCFYHQFQLSRKSVPSTITPGWRATTPARHCVTPSCSDTIPARNCLNPGCSDTIPAQNCVAQGCSDAEIPLRYP